ncbi:MAG: YidC/Oxa1 family membrane protein insertase [Spirochaetales bacterium]|nr:YidC/Oxa1 family membrane protein insertase [Spirochaetales bacterium]
MISKILYNIFIFPITEIIEFAFTFLTFTGNLGYTIIGLSFFITLVTLPIYAIAEHWQDIERRKTMEMAPRVKMIKEVFKGDEGFMILSTYYRQQGYRPIYALRSSFSILIQIPFFFAAYNFLSNLPVLKGYSFLFINDLGSPDGLLKLGPLTLNLLPILMTTFNCIAGFIYSKGHPLKEKIQIYGLAAIFLVILYNSPAGLLVYWTMNNFLSLVKNIFYKQKHPVRNFFFLLMAFGLVYGIHLYTKSRSIMNYGTLLFVIVALGYLIRKPLGFFYDHTLLWLEGEEKTCTKLFISLSVVLALLMGLLIPSSLIASSPVDFSFLHPYSSPLSFVLITFSQAVGICVAWPLILYFLFPKKYKNTVLLITLFYVFATLINEFVFTADYGVVSIRLEIDYIRTFFQSNFMTQMNTLCIIASLIAAIALCGTKLVKRMNPIFLILIIALTLLSFMKIMSIQKTYKDYIPIYERTLTDVEADDEMQPIIELSKRERNVIVFMMDRAISSYLPYILEENPNVRDEFEGFVFYPNTVSASNKTLHGTPCLFGGYDYSLQNLSTTRKDTELRVKHNEAISMLPLMFSKNGMNSFIVNAPWPNYEDISYVPFENIPEIKVTFPLNRYNERWKKEHGYNDLGEGGAAKILECSLIRYALFRLLPVSVRMAFYDAGRYYNTINPNLSYNDEPPAFMREYILMDNLSRLTGITDNNGTYTAFISYLTHEPFILQAPDYVFSKEVDNSNYDSPFKNRSDYCVNAASYRFIAEWLRYLKRNDVYDNTRIIFVSDHGSRSLHPDGNNPKLPDGRNTVDRYQALLLVKDFDQRSPLVINNDFMTLCDVPYLAAHGVLDSLENPYTGNELTMKGKENGFYVTSTEEPDPPVNPYKFPITKDEWFIVKDNILNPENWKQQVPEGL